jgi:4-oxalomesaconate hydratase
MGPLRLLVIGAHPADIFDQSGGTMAHHVARGDWVGCIVLTHGARVHDRVISDEMFHRKEIPKDEELRRMMAERSDVKAKEVIKACEIIGVRDVEFLGADDAVLLPTEENVRQVARLIRRQKPDIVITHFPKEAGAVGNPHALAGQIVMLALSLASAVDPGDLNPPHKVAQVFFFGNGAAGVRASVWSSEGGYYNDVFVDITDVAQLKVACIDALDSQGYSGAYARKRIEASDGAFGIMARVAYAEGFISANSTTHYHLPLSELDLKKSRLSDHQILEQMSYRMDPDKVAPRTPIKQS